MTEGSTRRPSVLLFQWLESQVASLGPESTAHCISEEEALSLFPLPPKGKSWASNMVLSTGTSSVNVLLREAGSEWHCRHVGQDFVFTRRRALRASLYFLPLSPPQAQEAVIAKVGFTSRPIHVRAKELRCDTPVLLEHGKVMTVRSVHGFQLESFLHALFAQRGQAVASKNKDGTTATELFRFSPADWARIVSLDLFDSKTVEDAKEGLMKMLGEKENEAPQTPDSDVTPKLSETVTPILPQEINATDDDISALIDKLSFCADE